MNELTILQNQTIQDKIYTIRGLQVMLDRDLAKLYNVETRALKQAVKRNIERFPEDFMFELLDSEIDSMVSQSVIPSKKHLGGAKPFVFTEQDVSTLSSVLSSDIAIKIHIDIMRAFVSMRKILQNNASLFARIETIEKRQTSYEIKTDSKIDLVLNALEDKNKIPSQGIFHNGQIYNAYAFVNDLLKSAKNEVTLIDNYIDDTIFTLCSKYPKIKFTIYTQTINKQLKLDFQKYKKQYKNVELKEIKNFHDRFLIIDSNEIYHLGASLKDLGNKIFAFSKLNIDIKTFEFLGDLSLTPQSSLKKESTR